ncbi:uncharacterized protein MAM_02102 [Metarhizium album ARSEF 1941]|uniref:Uncharacterized protein n=1 Tax=Metarhizium album (strain ARSEF 1941) TaxID=1081103 RepID=A0A0B2X1I5_METAS|nr:uncharacterized protein MAM_02102 [Metarhizium album ARSEF 1941]KHO00179.1 hypothetical protein MAM_02102 [Metarhizium album ARSEF 1941]
MAGDGSATAPGGQQESLERLLNDERNLRSFTEQVLDCRQIELEVAESENKRLFKKIDQLVKELSESKAQLFEARAQVKSKDRNLQEAGDHIFRLQSQREDITESDARDAYRALCDRIQRWVENRLPVTLEAASSGQTKKPPPAQATKFLSLLREPAKRCLSVHLSDEYHVVAAILYYLWLAFFSKPFYCPLDDSTEDATLLWILGTESAMAKSRNAEHCREWRSETLLALCTQKSFKSRRESYIYLISKDLSSYLTPVFPKISLVELQNSLRKAVVQPAADLAHRLHTSVNVFWLKWPLKTASTRLEVYECFNLADGGRVMDLGGTSPESPSRRNIRYMFDIAPGLFVERVDGGRKLPLKAICRPKVLIHSSESHVSHRATLLTWLYSATKDS